MKTRVFNYGQLFFSVVLCLSVTACNKEDYYQKEFLDNPYQENPKTEGPVDDGSQNGDDSGTEGGTQGGVDDGVGGTTGGTTDGSTTGGSSGGDQGSTTGGTDGSGTGGTTGGSTGGTTDGGSTGGSTGGTTDGGSTGGSTGGTTDGGSTGGSTGGTTDGGSTGGSTGGVDCNQGHGNDPDHVDESNPTIGTDPRCKQEIFHQASSQTKKLDIIWIVDNSGSMSDEQDALGVNFNAFIQDFLAKDVDFKMAITTTDARAAYKGLMVAGSDQKLTSAKAKTNESQFIDDFRRLVRVGTSGSGNEKGLEASEGFMNRYSAGFLRPDAYLAVVVLSDEEDQSAQTVSFYTDYLKSFKSEAGLVKVYSIVDVTNSNVGGSGVTTGHERYAEASQNTAGVVSDIRADFHNSLSAMGDSIINLLGSFALSHTPVDGTLVVYVNGVQTSNYTYDAASRSIKFDANNLPAVGAEIKVQYVKQ